MKVRPYFHAKEKRKKNGKEKENLMKIREKNVGKKKKRK